MANLNELSPASFRGVGFLVPNDTAEEGRNSIKHEYPDQIARYMEDNGYIPPMFEINAILHGKNSVGQLNRLRAALNQPGPGTLKHPYYGPCQVSVDGTYRVSRDDKNSGIINVTINFCTTSAPIFPSILSGASSGITGLSATLLRLLQANFIRDFPELPSIKSVEVVGEVTQNIASMLIDKFQPAEETYNAALKLQRKPLPLGSKPDMLIEIILSATRGAFNETSINSDYIAKSFMEIGVKLTETIESKTFEPSTYDRTKRQTALRVYSYQMQVLCFSSLCEALASKTYLTADAVAEDQSLILDAYSDLSEAQIDHETKAVIHDLFSETTEYLQNLRLSLPNIREIRVEEFPSSLLGYDLYESQEGIEQLVSLNSMQNPISYNETVKVLTSG